MRSHQRPAPRLLQRHDPHLDRGPPSYESSGVAGPRRTARGLRDDAARRPYRRRGQAAREFAAAGFDGYAHLAHRPATASASRSTAPTRRRLGRTHGARDFTNEPTNPAASGCASRTLLHHRGRRDHFPVNSRRAPARLELRTTRRAGRRRPARSLRRRPQGLGESFRDRQRCSTPSCCPCACTRRCSGSWSRASSSCRQQQA